MATNKRSASPDADKPKHDDAVEKLTINDATAEEQKTDMSDEPSAVELDGVTKEMEHEDVPSPKKVESKKQTKFSRKKLLMLSAAGLVVVVALLFIIPVTRYGILSVFMKKDVAFAVMDSVTHKPVSGVTVSAAGKSASTDAQGKATLHGVPVGNTSVTAKKKYYSDLRSTVLVPIFDRKDPYQLSAVATGRQVPVAVVNKVSGQPLAKAVITFDGASSTTDDKGEATLVLPANKETVQATLTADGFNQTTITVQVVEAQDPKNTFTLTPAGKVYFLSKRSGTIDVLKSDLDGSNVQTVLAGTGKEDDGATNLLASRDWKYLALVARREGDKSKLYFIDTTKSDKLSVMDEGDATFTPVGWYNEHFVYTLVRTQVQNWQPKKEALKSFNATNGQLSTLDESDGTGDASSFAEESFSDTYILHDQLVYTKRWYGDSSLTSSKHLTVNAVEANGQNKHVVKDLGSGVNSLAARLYAPEAIYFQLTVNEPFSNTYYEYEDGQFKPTSDVTNETFSKEYPTYLVSPSGKNTFWSEPRDGKNALFVGDTEGNNGKQLLDLADYKPYGWLSDNYLLVSKNNSELFILSRDKPATPFKITDYHKPTTSLTGYGYGYGGL